MSSIRDQRRRGRAGSACNSDFACRVMNRWDVSLWSKNSSLQFQAFLLQKWCNSGCATYYIRDTATGNLRWSRAQKVERCGDTDSRSKHAVRGTGCSKKGSKSVCRFSHQNSIRLSVNVGMARPFLANCLHVWGGGKRAVLVLSTLVNHRPCSEILVLYRPHLHLHE